MYLCKNHLIQCDRTEFVPFHLHYYEYGFKIGFIYILKNNIRLILVTFSQGGCRRYKI